MWLNSIIDGYKAAKGNKGRKYEYDVISSSPFLHSSGFLEEKMNEATNKRELECILDNLYRHDALFIRDEEENVIDVVPSYQKLEKQIIKRMGF